MSRSVFEEDLMNTNDFIGASFDELTREEMDFITGAAGTVQPQVTPTVVVSIASKVVGGGAVSFVGTYTASAAFKCR